VRSMERVKETGRNTKCQMHQWLYPMLSEPDYKSCKFISIKSRHFMVKVKLSLCLTKHHAMKTYWGGGIAPRILDLGSRGK